MRIENDFMGRSFLMFRYREVNLNNNLNNAKGRYQVCIRWNFIKEDIQNFKKVMPLAEDGGI